MQNLTTRGAPRDRSDLTGEIYLDDSDGDININIQMSDGREDILLGWLDNDDGVLHLSSLLDEEVETLNDSFGFVFDEYGRLETNKD